MKRISRYYHTLKYCRPSQLIWRCYYQWWRPRPNSRLSVALADYQVKTQVPFLPKSDQLIDEKNCCLLNETHDISHASIWRDPSKSTLWLYHLHYFHYLHNADPAVGHQALIQRWIAENPAPDSPGWDSYPLSMRIINWIKFHLQGHPLDTSALQSLQTQVCYLQSRLEYHLLGNHLLVNAKALVFAGLFFSGVDAKQCLAKGLDILNQQFAEQFLADGGHFELSPMYHALILEDILDMINVMEIYQHPVPSIWFYLAERMQTWLQTLLHPDGEISFFNDAAMAMASTPQSLCDYAVALNLLPPPPLDEEILFLSSSGYIRVTQNDMVALLDVANIAANYLPGHTHADTLSFELSLGKQRIFVNSGTSCYGNTAERQRQRSTGAHNTLTVDDKNSSGVWAGFRVGKRARINDVVIESDPHSVSASHDGYSPIIHRRHWQFAPQKLAIVDSIEGTGTHWIKLHLHLHPALKISEITHSTTLTLSTEHNDIECKFPPGCAIKVLPSTWHPQFGMAIPNQKIEISINAPLPCVLPWHIIWKSH